MAVLGFSIGEIHTIRNYLQINGRSHIGVKEFEKLYIWICMYIYIYIERESGQDQASKMYSVLKLTQPSINTCSGQKPLSYLATTLRNN